MGRLSKPRILAIATAILLTTSGVQAEEQEASEKKQEIQKKEYPVVFNTQKNPPKEEISTEPKDRQEDLKAKNNPSKDEEKKEQVRQESPAPPVTVPRTTIRRPRPKEWNVDVALSYGSKGIIRYTHNKFFDGNTLSASLSIKHNRSGLYIGGTGMMSPDGGPNNDTADRIVAFSGIEKEAGLFNVQFEYQYIATTPTIWGTDLIKDQHDVVLRIDLPPMLDQWLLVRTLAGYNANAQEERDKGIAFAGIGANLSILIFPELVSRNQFDIDVELVGKKTVNYTPKTNISSSFRVRARNILAPESLPFQLVGEANYLKGLRNDNRTEEFWFTGSIVITF